jgi:hypothetical protein
MSCPVTLWRTYLIAPSADNSSYVLLLMEVIWIAENINLIKQIQFQVSSKVPKYLVSVGICTAYATLFGRLVLTI